jgi:hypothetical protein
VTVELLRAESDAVNEAATLPELPSVTLTSSMSQPPCPLVAASTDHSRWRDYLASFDKDIATLGE